MRREAEREIETFILENNFIETEHLDYPRRAPDPDTLAASYGGPKFELEFRQFLTLETQIGLDIMKANLHHAQSLLATFRWQVMRSNLNDLSVRHHLKPTFQHCSKTFCSLSPEAENSLWLGFLRLNWAHFLVLLVLGFDEKYSPGKPYSIKRINKEILGPRNVPYKIDKDWNPKIT